MLCVCLCSQPNRLLHCYFAEGYRGDKSRVLREGHVFRLLKRQRICFKAEGTESSSLCPAVIHSADCSCACHPLRPAVLSGDVAGSGSSSSEEGAHGAALSFLAACSQAFRTTTWCAVAICWKKPHVVRGRVRRSVCSSCENT